MTNIINIILFKIVDIIPSRKEIMKSTNRINTRSYFINIT